MHRHLKNSIGNEGIGAKFFSHVEIENNMDE